MYLTKVLVCLLLRYTSKLSENMEMSLLPLILGTAQKHCLLVRWLKVPNEADSQEKPMRHVSSHLWWQRIMEFFSYLHSSVHLLKNIWVVSSFLAIVNWAVINIHIIGFCGNASFYYYQTQRWISGSWSKCTLNFIKTLKLFSK